MRILAEHFYRNGDNVSYTIKKGSKRSFFHNNKPNSEPQPQFDKFFI